MKHTLRPHRVHRPRGLVRGLPPRSPGTSATPQRGAVQGTIAGALANRRTTDRIPTSKGDLVVSPLDHASILFAWDGKAIYVDPTSPAIEDERYPKADLVLLTEAHFDHLDAVAVERLRKPGTVVAGPPAVAERTSVDVVLNEGDTRDVAGISVRAVPLYVTSSAVPRPAVLYRPRGRGVGYVLDLRRQAPRLPVRRHRLHPRGPCARARSTWLFIAVGPPLGMSPADAKVQCIEAMRPGIAFPYHDRYVDLTGLEQALASSGVDVRDRNFYPRAERWRRDAVTACSEGADRHLPRPPRGRRQGSFGPPRARRTRASSTAARWCAHGRTRSHRGGEVEGIASSPPSPCPRKPYGSAES